MIHLVIVWAEKVLWVFLLRRGAVPVAAAVVGVRPPARPRLRAVERPLRRRAVLLCGRGARRCPAVLIIISDRATRVMYLFIKISQSGFCLVAVVANWSVATVGLVNVVAPHVT